MRRPVVTLPILPRGDSPVHEELALRERLAELRRGASNSYQTNFHKFLTECVQTKDEARGGIVRPFPSDAYVKEVCDVLMEEPLVFFEKSRRTRITWLVSALDLWIAAGGQDPRWPALMLSTGNRQVIIGCRKLEGIQGSAWILGERVRFIYRVLMENGIRERWPGFPVFEFKFDQATGSNGSLMNAVPQGEDQCRGPGATFMHLDEISHWDRARGSVGAALPCTLGGGRVCLIGTPNTGTFAHELRDGVI